MEYNFTLAGKILNFYLKEIIYLLYAVERNKEKTISLKC